MGVSFAGMKRRICQSVTVWSCYATAVSKPDKPATVTLRERTREAARAEIRREAIALFLAKGFDATTAEDVARAVGISSRTFFRYFPTKDDVLVGDATAFGERIRDAFAARPADEGVWVSLRAALEPLATAITTDDPARSLAAMQVIMSAASLRAAHVEKHLAWGRMLAPLVETRLDGPDATRPLRAASLVNAAMACLDAAFAEWVRRDGEPDLAALLDASFAAVAAA